jgi:hypothetical protein
MQRVLRELLPGYWQDVRAAEIVADEIAAEFGEDALKPVLRSVLDRARDSLLELHRQVELLDDEAPELTEPDDEVVRAVRSLVDKAHIARW